MAVSIRVRSIKAIDVEVMLVRAPGENNSGPPRDAAIHGYECRFARRNPVTHNEWLVIVTSGAAGTFGAAVVQAITAWVNSRNGRRFRIKRGDREYEAPSLPELKKLMSLAGDELEIRVITASGRNSK
jgi:hypothetical protein